MPKLDYLDCIDKNHKIILTCIITVGLVIVASGLAVGSTIFVTSKLQPVQNSFLIQYSMDNSTNTIYRTYGEKLDLSSVNVYYENSFGKQFKDEITESMLVGYDPEHIGNQHISGIKYSKKTGNEIEADINIYTYPADINTPYLEFTKQALTWGEIPNSCSYRLYYGQTKDELNLLTELTTTKYDLSSFQNYGNWYFAVNAVKASEKYNDSDQSNIVSVYNLAPAQNIKYYNGVISWNPVAGASSYAIEINGNKTEGIKTNSFDYVFDSGTYDIKVYSYSDIENSISSVSSTYKFSLLDKVSSIENVGGFLNWNDVLNAEEYEVYVNGSLYSTVTESKIASSEFEAGVYKIGIRAKSSNESFVQSDVVEFNVLLNLSLSINNQILSWGYVGAGYSYRLIVDDVPMQEVISSTSIDLKSTVLTSGNHTLKIKVEGSNTLVIDQSLPITVTKLSAPVLSLSGGVITCDSSSHVVKYYLDGVEFDGSSSSITASRSHSVTAKYLASKDSEIDSDLSASLSLTKLAAPAISVSNGQLTCDRDDYSVQYYVDGTAFDGDLDGVSEGSHVITARYVATSGDQLDSELSSSITINKLAAPVISVSGGILSCDSTEHTIQYYCDGFAFDGNLSNLSAGDHSITAKYKTSNSSEIDSGFSSAITVTKLSAPVLSLSGGVITCDSSSHVVKYYLDGVEFDGSSSSITASKSHSVTAKYLASRDSEIDSDLSASLSLTKLEAPAISVSNGQLTCDRDDYSVQYYVDGTAFDGDLDGVSEGSHVITARYVATSGDQLNSELSSSITINKLAAPVISVSGGILSCDSTEHTIQYYCDGFAFDGNLSNLSAGDHSITAKYKTSNSSEIDSGFSSAITVTKLSAPVLSLSGGVITCDSSSHVVKYYLDGVEFDGSSSSITASKSHSVTAKYLASRDSEIDSDLSASLSLTKLAAPAISVSNGQLTCDRDDYSVQYYVDGTAFDGDLDGVSEGSHVITARYVATSGDQLDSELSSSITINKLAAPVISVSGGILSCDSTEHTIQYYCDGFAFDGNLSNLSAGDHSITAKYKTSNSSEIDSGFSSAITVTKLSAPVLSLSGGVITCDSSSHVVKYYLDGVEFDGSSSSITASRSHSVTAKYLASKDSEIDSDLSASLSLTKLEAPAISVSNGQLTCDRDDYSVQYYVDGTAFDGDLDGVSEGSHVITARYVATSGDQLDSELSSSITINKLAAPTIAFDNYQLSCTANNINVVYYVDGTQFDGDLGNLSAGCHTITARNLSSDSSNITSSESNSINIYKSDFTYSVSATTNNRIILSLDSASGNLVYDLDIYFYNDVGEEIDSLSYTDRNVTAQTISYSRSGVIASSVKLVVKPHTTQEGYEPIYITVNYSI